MTTGVLIRVRPRCAPDSQPARSPLAPLRPLLRDTPDAHPPPLANCPLPPTPPCWLLTPGADTPDGMMEMHCHWWDARRVSIVS